MIVLTTDVRDEIFAEGERAYPDECCGFLLGDDIGVPEDGTRLADAVVVVSNARDASEAYHRFEIEPLDFLRAEREAAEEGKDVVGIYHSHPDHPAAPSDYDLEHALPYYSYVIVSVAQGKAKDLKSWRLKDDRRGFAEEAIGSDGRIDEQ